MRVPIDSGYGESYGRHTMTTWDPAAAFAASQHLQEVVREQTKTNEYRQAIAKLPRLAHVQVTYNGESMTVPEYAEVVDAEVAAARAQLRFYGGQQAVAAFELELET